MRTNVWVVATALLVAPAVAGGAPSFPCAKATTRVEKAICASSRLSLLDEHLGRYYQAARQTLGQAADCLGADQRQWLRVVRDACADEACLEKAYLARLGELDALQPGVTAIKQFPLPPGPSLVWIIPAALDQVAAPPRPDAKPLVARGAVVDDLATGDGFLLRTAEGASYPLVLAMFIEPDSATRLTVLAKERGATFLARGHAVMNDRGQTYFEPSRCVFLYRLP